MGDDRRERFEKCRHEWVPANTPAMDGTGKPGRTIGTRCRHCGRYSYRPSPPAEPHRPTAR